MAKTLEFISINFWHIVMTWGNLLILVWLMKKFLFKPVDAILEKRKNEVGEIYAQAESAQESAEADKAEYETKLASVNEQAAVLMEQASKNAKERSAEIIKSAQDKAQLTMQKAQNDIAQQSKKALNEAKGEISGIAFEIAQQILTREIDTTSHEQLIEQFIDDVGEPS